MAEQLERYTKRLKEVWIGLIFLVGALGIDEGRTLWPLSWDMAINFAVCVQFMLRWSQGNDDLTSATFSRFAAWHQGRGHSAVRARFWHLVFYYSVTIVIFGAMLETVSSRRWFRLVIVALLLWDLYQLVFDERARFTWTNGRYFLRRLLRREWSQLGLWTPCTRRNFGRSTTCLRLPGCWWSRPSPYGPRWAMLNSRL